MQIIAEIGINHFGSMQKAKDLIKAAVNSGADMVKSQAFKACDVYLSGSKDYKFYKNCEFTMKEHAELIKYAHSLGMHKYFYSIFSREYMGLANLCHGRLKIAASQIHEYSNEYFRGKDIGSTYVSFREDFCDMKKAHILYAGDYLTEPKFERLIALRKYFFRKIGYSDHTKGIDNCIEAHEEYGSDLIEKHFTLERNDFRDTQHGATPQEFEQLVKRLK